MVQGRMPRETNPVPGEKPGYTANHDSTGNEDYVRTSPINPLPVNDDATKTELEEIKQQQIDLNAKVEATNTRLNEVLDVKGEMQLTGSIVAQRGLAANKPAATSVEPGTTYWSVDSDPHGNEIEVSDGTKWTVI
ncbi:hypothetical protein KK120_08695 [Virgibacillus dakarensis]|nr:hypothetical protein [Virgibacillus dakarensis]MBT2215899.1 hypothetical protein [Virgibacillus dakarensis]